MKRSLEQLAADYGGTTQGDAGTTVTGIAVVAEAGPEHLAPLFHRRYLGSAREGRAGVLLTDARLALQLPDRPLWIHPNPRLALARLLDELHPAPPVEPFRHPSAVVASSARVAPTCRLEALVVVEDEAVIGPRCHLGPRSIIGSGVRLGSDCQVGPGAMVLAGSEVGDRVRIGPGAVIGSEGFGFLPGAPLPTRVPQVGGVVIEDDVELGALAAVDRATIGATVIRRGAKLDNLVQVGHNAEVGPGALIAAQSGLAGSSTIGEGALLGGQVGVGDHFQVGAGARVAAKSGVAGDIPKNVTYAGYPAVPRFKWLRAWASLLRWSSHRGEGRDR